MKPQTRTRARDDEKALLRAELGVDAVYLVDQPVWYLRAVGRFHLSWRREVAFELGLLGVGVALGLVLRG